MADNKTLNVGSGNGGHDDFIPIIWAKTALGVLHRNAVMASLVDRDWGDALATQGDTIRIPKRGTLTVGDKSADTAVVPQQPSGDKVDVILDKHKYISFLVEDVLDAQSSVKNMLGYVGDGARKISKQLDTDLLTLYASMANEVGTGGAGLATTTDSATILAAKAFFDNQEAPDGRLLVIAPEAENDLLQCDKFVTAEKIGNATAVREGVAGRIYGFDTFMDPRVVSTGVSPQSQHNVAFVEEGLALVTRPLAVPPRGTGVQAAYFALDGIGIRIVYGYNMDYMAMQVNMDILYGVKIIRDELCCEVKS